MFHPSKGLVQGPGSSFSRGLDQSDRCHGWDTSLISVDTAPDLYSLALCQTGQAFLVKLLGRKGLGRASERPRFSIGLMPHQGFALRLVLHQGRR